MIKKPDSKDFRESTAVKILRGTGATAKEAATTFPKVIGKVSTALPALSVFVSVASIGGIVGMVTFLIGFGLIVIVPRSRMLKQNASDSNIGSKNRSKSDFTSNSIDNAKTKYGSYDFSYNLKPLISRSLYSFFIGLILLMMPNLLFIPITIILFLYSGLLILQTVRGEYLLSFDKEQFTVNGPFGSETISSQDMIEVDCHEYSHANLYVLLTAGARKVLRIKARKDQLKTVTLLVPLEFLGLNDVECTKLIAQLLALNPKAITTPSPAIAPEVPDIFENWATTSQSVPAYKDTTTNFDPDAIMARYLEKRNLEISQAQPESMQPRAKSASQFGRKAV